MEIEPISSTSGATDRWLELRSRQAEVSTRTFRSVDRNGEAPQADPPAEDPVDVQIVKHSGTGAQTVRIVEPGSGRVISQIPPEQVLDLVAALIEFNQRHKQGGSGDGEQR